MKQFGIDISRWQGNFDFKAAIAEGVKFAIIKGGGGDAGLYVDKMFERNYTQAKENGLNVGCYWFSKATTVQEAEAEADYFYNNVIKGKQFELPVYMDVEHQSMLTLGRVTLTKVIKAFCERMESYKCWVGIYSTTYMFMSYMNDDELLDYAHWVAQWAKECTYSHVEVLGMWQFGGETNLLRSNKIAGVTCDQNYMYIDYPSLIKEAGLNGFAITEVKPTSPLIKSTDEIVDEVIAGKWGNGAERRRRLEAEGYDYNIIQGMVDARLKPKETVVMHTVKKNENLTVIANRYGTTIHKIAADNNIKNVNVIREGQVLKIVK